MAIDTAAKRKSVAATGRKWRAPILVPDGSLSQADRQAAGRSYSGILAAVAAIGGFLAGVVTAEPSLLGTVALQTSLAGIITVEAVGGTVSVD